MPDRDPTFTDALDDVAARMVAIAGLGGVALIHALQLPDASAAAAYIAALFTIVAVSSVALAALMTRTSDDRAWLAAGVLPALVMIGYFLSRTTGLPSFTEDIGEWSEPLGLASLVFEGLLICVSAAVLAPRYARHAPRLAADVDTTRARSLHDF